MPAEALCLKSQHLLKNIFISCICSEDGTDADEIFTRLLHCSGLLGEERSPTIVL